MCSNMNGLPFSTKPYDRFAKNDRSVGGTVNLVSGSTNTYNSVLFFEPDCKNYKYVVQKIIFTDGTEWQNPYIYIRVDFLQLESILTRGVNST